MLETPSGSIDLKERFKNALGIQDYIRKERRDFLNTHNIFKAVPNVENETPDPSNSTIFMNDASVYDIRARNGGLDVFVRNQTAHISRLHIANWDTMDALSRPNIVDAEGLIDLRNHTAESITQMCEEADPVCSTQNEITTTGPQALWIKTSHIPYLHVNKTPTGFSVHRDVFDRHHQRQCSSWLFPHNTETWLVFYDHTTPYTDTVHNETGALYHITPDFWPLKINVTREQVQFLITPVSHEDAKVVLNDAQTNFH